jgi:hypothetical protein
MAEAMFTAAREKVACPRCGASPGEPCRTPKGRNAKVPHNERCNALVELTGIEPYTVKTTKLSELLKEK